MKKYLIGLFLIFSLSGIAQDFALNTVDETVYFINSENPGYTDTISFPVSDLTYQYSSTDLRLNLWQKSAGKFRMFFYNSISNITINSKTATADKLKELRALTTLTRASNTTNFWVEHAKNQIYGTYGKRVKVKPKTLLKFGKNSGVNTAEETIMELLGSEVKETYATGNTITAVSSDSASNVENIVIEGHTIDGSKNLTFVVQSSTLNGQNQVLLTTPLARATRIYVADSINLAVLSKAYVYDTTGVTLSGGVPSDASKVHVIMSALENQSLKAATAYSSVDYGAITHVYATVDKKTTATVDIRLKIREKNGVFRDVFTRTISSTGKQDLDFPIEPYIIAPANCDIVLAATASTVNVSVSGGFNSLILTEE